MKKLVVCLDGTDQTKTQQHPTNIALLFDALGGAPQSFPDGSYETSIDGDIGVGKYLPGVGTQGDPVLKVLGSAFGDGIAEPIIRGYTFLSRNYSAGDQIFIVGFSRGATAARALAGLVVSSGLLNAENYNPAVKTDAYARAVAAWYQYRQNQPDQAQQGRKDDISQASGQDIPTLTAGDFVLPVQVQAVGVFDTVSSLGLPHLDSDGDAKFDFSICDTNLAQAVLNGFHALAADETRDLFAPTFWSARDGVVQQIFPGAHSNVGGGYPERGLSDGALDWMLTSLTGVGYPASRAKIVPPINRNPLDVARDDGAGFPFNLTPRRARVFPDSAGVNAFLQSRIGHAVECLPNPQAKPYAPTGKRSDGSPL